MLLSSPWNCSSLWNQMISDFFLIASMLIYSGARRWCQSSWICWRRACLKLREIKLITGYFPLRRDIQLGRSKRAVIRGKLSDRLNGILLWMIKDILIVKLGVFLLVMMILLILAISAVVVVVIIIFGIIRSLMIFTNRLFAFAVFLMRLTWRLFASHDLLLDLLNEHLSCISTSCSRWTFQITQS